jgi:hypothetical protein
MDDIGPDIAAAVRINEVIFMAMLSIFVSSEKLGGRVRPAGRWHP